MIWLLLLLALNFGIAWWNAYVCGKSWAEANAVGGWIKLVVWCGAIQSAIGFSMVFMFGLVGIGLLTGLIGPAVMKLSVAFFYLAVIIPALGTGLIIMVHSWIVAWRERDIMSMGVGAYNTLAMAHNVYSAASGIGTAFDMVKENLPDVDDWRVLVALLVAAIAILGGTLLTATLIQRYAATVPLPEHPEANRVGNSGISAIGGIGRNNAWTR